MTESTSSLYFADLTSPEVEALRQSNKHVALLLPVGATEPHGPHAPLSTDSLISASTCERAARRLTADPDVAALVLPPVLYGVTTYAAAFAGVVHVSSETLRSLIVDVCTSLVTQGFPHVVIVNNHFEPGHVQALRQAVETVNADFSAVGRSRNHSRGVAVRLLDLLRRRHVERLTAEFQAGESHASAYETSMVLAERPDLVDVERMRVLPPVRVDMAQAIADGRHDFLSMGMDDAYCGDPARATAEEGEATFTTLTDMVVELVRESALRTGVMQGEDPS